MHFYALQLFDHDGQLIKLIKLQTATIYFYATENRLDEYAQRAARAALRERKMNERDVSSRKIVDLGPKEDRMSRYRRGLPMGPR